MNFLLHDLGNLPLFASYLKGINKGPVLVSGLTDVSKVQIACATNEFSDKPVCIITYNELQAKRIINDLKFFEDNVKFFPKREIVTYDFACESKDLPYERIEVLNSIQNGNVNIVVTTIEAIMQNMISKKSLYKNIINLNLGVEYSLEKLKNKLVELGYERVELVESRGSFSVRGGIIDVAISEIEGIRIEFWGDEVDSIRTFKLSSQRSIQNLDCACIYPAHEFILEKSLEEVTNNILDESIANTDIQEIVNLDIEEIREGNYFSKIDKYFNSFYSEKNNFLDFLQEDTIIFLDEDSKISKRMENIVEDNKNLVNSLIEKNRVVPDSIKNISEYQENIKWDKLIYLEKQDISNKKNIEREYHFHYREVNFFKSETGMLIDELKSATDNKKKIALLGGNENSARKMSLLLAEYDIPHMYNEKPEVNSLKEGVCLVTKGALTAGFECYDLDLLVISSEEFFNNEHKKRKQSQAFREGEKVVFADLRIGDFVVHKFHGIGQFIGVNTIKADSVTKDYIKIKYKNEDVLYVPTNNLDTVRKYIGGGEVAPRLNKLGGKEWDSTKTKVKSNLREVARELIELYAKRQKVKGYAFSKDTEWQKQFEDSFPYSETDDQLRCIEETKKDMENEKPMDRLLCRRCWIWKNRGSNKSSF